MTAGKTVISVIPQLPNSRRMSAKTADSNRFDRG
jgi:hypothetical protein